MNTLGLRGFASRIAAHWKRCLYNNKNDLERFQTEFACGYAHYTGEHSGCTHPPTQKFPEIKRPEDQKKLEEILDHWADEGKQSINHKHTCWNESFNSLITDYAPKGVAFSQSTYEAKVACAVLHNNEGVSFRERLVPVLMDALKNSRFVQFPLRDLDVEINPETDLPANCKQAKKLDTVPPIEYGGEADDEKEPKKNRKTPQCRTCKVPLRGHSCPHRKRKSADGGISQPSPKRTRKEKQI